MYREIFIVECSHKEWNPFLPCVIPDTLLIPAHDALWSAL